MNSFIDNVIVIFFVVVLGVVPTAAWFTHVVTCIQTEAWGFLIAGAIFFPVGIVHGAGIWLGVW